jgi:hypothetical protein
MDCVGQHRTACLGTLQEQTTVSTRATSVGLRKAEEEVLVEQNLFILF